MVTLFCFSHCFYLRNVSSSFGHCSNNIVKPKCKTPFSKLLRGYICYIHACFISNTFVSNARLKLAKNEANAKQVPDAEPFENYSHSSST